MATPNALHHSLLRPVVLHILRAAGYHSTRPSVLDAFTDIAGRYMFALASAAARYAEVNHDEIELGIQDIRMAMQQCGAIAPEKVMEEQLYDDIEDVRGVNAFIEWAMGPANKEIRRIALEGGEEGKEDYLIALKKKYDKTGDESRYQGTLLGKASEARPVPIEGGDAATVQEWAEKVRSLKRKRSRSKSMDRSRAQSSDLSSLGDEEMAGMEFDSS
jgi:transcription initiation factor TFIID subunit 3